jgi:hypothetical protein
MYGGSMGIRVDSPPIVFSLVMATMGIAGCGASHGSDAPDAAVAVDASVPIDAAGPSDGPTFTSQDGGVPAALSLSVAPSATTLVVTDLAALPSTTFVVTAKLADGTTAHGNASWSVDRLDIATVGAGDGVVTAAGTAFGTATVTASAFGLTAQATITIGLKTSMLETLVSAADQASLAGASASDPSVTAFAYPYDKTVFPLGVLAPELMWNGGGAGDVYLVHVTAANFDLAVFTNADPPSRYTLPPALWKALTVTAAGANVEVTLSRLSGASATTSARESWTIANANLSGSIYYWSIADGQILRLDVTTGAITPAFDSGSALTLGSPTPLVSASPAQPPWEDALPGDRRCVACHAVSKDGATLGAVFSRGNSAGPFGFVDVPSAQVKAIGDYTINGAFEALTPDGKYAVVNDNFMTLALADTSTGSIVPSLFDGQTNLCDPVFSPDGTKFAVATSCGLNDPLAYPVQYGTSSLSLFDFTQGPSPTFANPRTLVAGSGAPDGGSPDGGPAASGGDAIAFPSFSPDSQWVFYQRGTSSRAKINFSMPYTHGIDDLFVTAAQPGAAPIALDQANGKGVLSADNLHLNYAPTVNPISEGGYIWVVFTSPRDYGNRLGSTRVAGATSYPGDATYANNKQLWVSAVDVNVQTSDPSHPAFWLPGQSTDSINMFGYWALALCKSTADDAGAPQSCNAGFECCSGFCRAGVCSDRPSGCHQEGEACASSADCCTTASVGCVAGVCQQQGTR